MPEDQPRVVEALRRRPWRSAAIVAFGALVFLVAAAVRRQALRTAALDNWAARSSTVARLSGINAGAWLAMRSADTRLLASAAARTPDLFGFPPAPGTQAITPAALSKSLAQNLTTINQLHSYSAIWLVDRNGRVTGATSSSAPSEAVLKAAAAALATDSGAQVGPYSDSDSLSFAFGQRVMLPAPISRAGEKGAYSIIGSVVLVTKAAPLLSDLSALIDRSTNDTTSLIVGSTDSLFVYALTPDRSRGKPLAAWPRSAAPRSALAAFARKPDPTAVIAGSSAEFSSRIGGVPWALMRIEPLGSIFAGVNGRLSTEASTAAAVLFMIAIIVIGRRQTTRERKLIEVAESEVRYRLLADNATDVIARHAPDGRILYISPAVQTILGYQPRQLQGRYPSEFFHEDDATTMNDILDVLRATNGVSRAEHRLRHSKGHYVWLETTGRAVRDPVWGNVTELVTVSRDIEDRKKAEEARRASEEDYRMLFQSNPLPMWAFDADTYQFVAVNDEAVSHYGYSREEFLGMTIFDIRPPEDAARVRERVASVRAGLQNMQGVRHQKKDGSLMDVDLTVHEVKLSGRKTRLVLVKDMTEARRAATALRESNELIRALFDSSPVAIIATDLALRVLQWNGAAERLFGWAAAEVVGGDYPLATPEMFPDVRRIRERALRDGTFTDVHAQRVRKDGSTVELSLSVGVIRDALLEPAGYVLLAADVSERTKLEAQLRHAQKMDAVGQLAGGVAHDFNNLLTVVTGYAGILLADLAPDSTMRPDVEEILAASNRAGELTRQLLAFSRQQMLQPKVLDLNSVVKGMEQMLRRVLPADINFVTGLDPALSAVNADPGQIEQVLMNLIVNARDAMPDGGTLTIETKDIAIDAAAGDEHEVAPGDYVMLRVSDTGCGMTRAVQARVFEPFFTTKARGEGTGLGLSTAHGIVTQSGGCLTVRSELGLGTTISVCLPRVDSRAGTTAPQPPLAAGSRGAEVILLVEDDPSVRLTTRRLLERAGYAVLAASDGNEALAIHESHASGIDLLVSDMIMPGMSGRELVSLIRERNPDMAVLLMSGYTEQAARHPSLAEARCLFIDKPFTSQELTEKVRLAIDGGSPVPESASI